MLLVSGSGRQIPLKLNLPLSNERNFSLLLFCYIPSPAAIRTFVSLHIPEQWQRDLSFPGWQKIVWYKAWTFLSTYIYIYGCINIYTYIYTHTYIYRVSQEERTKLRECVPYVKLLVYRYNPKHLYPKLNGYGDNGQRSLKVWQLLRTYWLQNTY